MKQMRTIVDGSTNGAWLVEYQVLQDFRLEWSMMGHRWGYYLVPLCGAILWWSWNFSRENLFIGIFLTIILLFVWRYIHHYYDNVVKTLYLRLVEIEEKLDMRFTRSYLTQMMQKSKLFNQNFQESQLVTSAYILRYPHKKIFGPRGLEKWDFWGGVAMLISCLWLCKAVLDKLHPILLENRWIPPLFPQVTIFSLAFVLPMILYGWYFRKEDKQD